MQTQARPFAPVSDTRVRPLSADFRRRVCVRVLAGWFRAPVRLASDITRRASPLALCFLLLGGNLFEQGRRQVEGRGCFAE